MKTICKKVAFMAAAALTAVAQPAFADSRGYVVGVWAPAMYNKDESDCPEGKNPIANAIMARILREEGKTQAEIDKIIVPGVYNNRVHSQYATMRGRVDGKPVNVYHNPLSVPDPGIKLAVSKEAYGFNLDGKEGPNEYTDPQTGEKGVDNVGARIFGCFDRTRGTLDAPPAHQAVRWSQTTAAHSWLIEVNKPDGALTLKNDNNVEVTFYRGMQPVMKSATGFQRDVTYDINPSPAFPTTKYKGKIIDGMFVSDGPVDFNMVANSRIQTVFDFKQSRLRITFKPDGSIEGVLGGYQQIKLMYLPYGNYASSAEFNGGMDIPGIYYAMRRLADTDIDKDPATGARTRISHTYMLLAVPAYVVHPQRRMVISER